MAGYQTHGASAGGSGFGNDLLHVEFDHRNVVAELVELHLPCDVRSVEPGVPIVLGVEECVQHREVHRLAKAVRSGEK